jgi:hypothetical protein
MQGREHSLDARTGLSPEPLNASEGEKNPHLLVTFEFDIAQRYAER